MSPYLKGDPMSANIELLYIASLGKQHHVEDLGKKKFQKLVYLIETVGHIDLGYSYQIHLYGPFSKALDDDLRELSSIKQVNYTRSNQSFLLGVTAEGAKELHEADGRIRNQQTIDNVFTQFCSRSPRDLELLTTSCFVCNKLGSDATRDELKSCVQRIKGSKFKSSLIEESIDEALALTTE